MGLKNKYNLLIKKNDFNPSAFAGKIPYWADGKNNPDCIGSAKHQEFWEEQVYYCVNGYKSGGVLIRGRHFYYLNHCIIDGLYGPMFPIYVDLDHEYSTMIDEIKNDPLMAGHVDPKARRKGRSYYLVHAVVGYGIRFVNGYKAGVAAGLDTYKKGFQNKLNKNFNNTSAEFQMNILKRNENELIIGYEEKMQSTGQFDDVVNAHIMFATMQDDATKFEGEYFHDVILEEVGQFEKADRAFTSILPALKLGREIGGTFHILGTGGNVLKGSRSFKLFVDNAEAYGLKVFFIPGNRLYFPFIKGSRDENGSLNEKTPYLDAQYPKKEGSELLGCEDVKAADDDIRNALEQFSKNPNKRALIEWKQANPETIEDVFTSSGSNQFNSEKLYTQLFNIDSQKTKWREWYLDFVKDSTGNYKIPLEVEAKAAKKSHRDWELVPIYKHPMQHIRNLDIGGIDGYNEDRTDTSKSLGSIIVLRQNDKYIKMDPKIDDPGRLAVCLYYKRPPRKELFWEISLKVAVYYNLIQNTMISAESDNVIKFFLENHGRKYLSPRPKSFDSPTSKVYYEYGAKMSSYSKPRMLGLMQSHIEDNAQYMYFRDLIIDHIAYDEERIGTDWDSADAEGLALIRIADLGNRSLNNFDEDQNKSNPLDLLGYEERNGIIVQKEIIRDTTLTKEQEAIPDPFEEFEKFANRL